VGDDFVSVFSTQSWVDAEITKGRLEAEGIPVELKGVSEGPYPVGPAELFVPSTSVEQARRIIEQIRSGAYEIPDDRRDDEDEPERGSTD